MFGNYTLDPEGLADVAKYALPREACPCSDQTAAVLCKPRGFPMDGGGSNGFGNPPACTETDEPLTTTPVCGSIYTGTGLEVYAQYCASEVESVRESTQLLWSDFQETLETYNRIVQSQIAYSLVNPAAVLATMTGAFASVEAALEDIELLLESGEASIQCLLGCAEFVANICCEDKLEFREDCGAFLEGSFNGLESPVPTEPATLGSTLVAAGRKASNTCGSGPASFPGVTMAGETIEYRVFDALPTINVDTGCYTVRVYQSTECAPDSILVATYAPSFDPANLSLNFEGYSARITEQISEFSIDATSLRVSGWQLVAMQTRPSNETCSFRITVYDGSSCLLDEPMEY